MNPNNKKFSIQWNLRTEVAKYIFADKYTKEEANQICENLNRANPLHYYEVIVVKS